MHVSMRLSTIPNYQAVSGRLQACALAEATSDSVSLRILVTTAAVDKGMPALSKWSSALQKSAATNNKKKE
jgi:hypothetical protein